MIIYVETSAATKLLIDEQETPAMREFFNGFAEDGHVLVSSVLLETEVRRASIRAGVSQIDATDLLARFDLVDTDRATYSEAGRLPEPALRSLDALHLASALRIGVDLFVSYDQRQIAVAEGLGLRVVSPR